MPLLFEEKYYQAVRPYLPEDAKSVLDQQIPLIQAKVAADIDAFAASFAAEVKVQADKQLKKTQDELKAIQDTITTRLTVLSAQTDPAKLVTEAAQLAAAVKAYQDQIAGLGETLRTSALTALKAAAGSAGLPVALIA